MALENNLIRKAVPTHLKDQHFITVNHKKNDEMIAKMVSLLKNKVVSEGIYFFKKYQQRKNKMNELIGFVLVFENKKNISFIFA